ncbi:Adenosylcobinamide-phosphateguanylyltransferase [Desulfofarcimen acetoxidans DSM 771]|uniref:Adenosylcobinamide kinase n=1 Tax=Desulfofarcimen acetoxidans (strain ATCC 49208 / DSM 771 / KCTC 5769 / VKM B-1644 / 5575) TaxID=485916 RepID=C8W3R0_DESAS|nr:bifunctional adenosylcobinamide kinase/adenosylcobinamide-phosphate guanylyltransferase [Desulfofarcimen acetoxidans]ACV63846.1 Adenosylcobinamide-phosphateguanylyltransferase [Desulfofarcimen acetoxidans DSM 771]
MQGKLILVTGGSRSGKSSVAEHLAKKIGGSVVYIASAAALDEEMLRRVAKHRSARPAHWQTIEETHDIPRVLRHAGQSAEVILLDCLTLWISNLLLDDSLMGGKSDEEKEACIINRVDELVQAALSVPAHVLVVSSEVGQGIVPEYPISRLYRDIVGLANQKLAFHADEVYLTVAGIPVELKSLAAEY